MFTGRLIDVDKNSSAYSDYTYDDNSNRTSGNIGGTSFSAVYDAHDRLTDWGVYDYTYTTAGELSTKVNTLLSQTTTYVYDVLGNLKSVTLPNSDVVSYEADAFNRRVLRKFNGTVTSRYLYRSQYQIVAELDDVGAIKARFVYGTRENVPDYMVKGGNLYRIVSDHLGSVRMVVKVSDGTVSQKIDYNELGRVLSDTNPGFQPFAFAGGLYDSATGLVRFGHRDYDPETGRWTSKDPILFGGGDANLYGYVVQDPLNGIDPTGLMESDMPYSGHHGWGNNVRRFFNYYFRDRFNLWIRDPLSPPRPPRDPGPPPLDPNHGPPDPKRDRPPYPSEWHPNPIPEGPGRRPGESCA